MKELVFDSTLSIQVPELDDDHSKLLDLFNLISQEITEGAAPDYIQALLEELISCTIWHFRHEERLMLRYGYEDLADHREEHQELVESARELQQRFLLKNDTLSSDELEFLEHWLTGHILGSDMRLGEYLTQVI